VVTTDSAVSDIRHYAGLLAIELDPQYTDLDSVPPEPLSVAAATALASHLAKDLSTILGGIEHLGLIFPGALYDQTEILRPGLPLIEALADLYRGSLRNSSFEPRLIALGTDRAFFPVSAINPLRRPGSGPLLLLPFCLVGPDKDIALIARTMEDTLMQNGQVSPATAEAVGQAFGLTMLNISFVTVSDLCALLRVQLESHGFLPLWELLEHAWFQQLGSYSVTLESGNRFVVSGDHAHTPFYTFDDWAQFGPGKKLPSSKLGAGYSDWVRMQRQYASALEAYGLHARRVLANPRLEEALATEDNEAALEALREIPCLSGDYLVERIFHNDSELQEQAMLITHQADPELGTLAYTVITLDGDGQLVRLEHHYPLQPQGVRVIADQLTQRCTEQGMERQVLHPGRLLYSDSSRSLQPATLADLPASTERLH